MGMLCMSPLAQVLIIVCLALGVGPTGHETTSLWTRFFLDVKGTPRSFLDTQKATKYSIQFQNGTALGFCQLMFPVQSTTREMLPSTCDVTVFGFYYSPLRMQREKFCDRLDSIIIIIFLNGVKVCTEINWRSFRGDKGTRMARGRADAAL